MVSWCTSRFLCTTCKNTDKSCFADLLTATCHFALLTHRLLWLSGLVCQLSCHLSLPSLFPPFLLPWIGSDNLLLLLKARSPLENSVTCLSGRISMEDLQSQRSTSMDWLSKFTGPSLHSHCRPLISSETLLVFVGTETKTKEFLFVVLTKLKHL